MFVRRKKYADLEAVLVKAHNEREWYKQQLLELEEAFPVGKRQRCEELFPYLEARFAAPGDIAAPVISDEIAEREIRKLLELIEATLPNLPNAVANRPK